MQVMFEDLRTRYLPAKCHVALFNYFIALKYFQIPEKHISDLLRNRAYYKVTSVEAR